MKSDFLKSLKSYSDIDTVIESLSNFKILAETTSNIDNKTQDSLDNSLAIVVALKADLQRKDRVISIYQQTANSSISLLKKLIDSSITDYLSAYNATILYDKDWFANTMFSEEGKIDVASYILRTVYIYTQDNTETLSMISNRDQEILDYISYPRQTKG